MLDLVVGVMKARNLTMLLVTLGLAGCAAAGTPTAVGHPRCASGTASPISLRIAKAKLASAGYQTGLDRSLCERSGAEANQGDVTFTDSFCEVEMRSPPRQKTRPATEFEGPNYSGKAYVVTYENLDCWIYNTGDNRKTIVKALRTMFKRFGAQHILVQKTQA